MHHTFVLWWGGSRSCCSPLVIHGPHQAEPSWPVATVVSWLRCSGGYRETDGHEPCEVVRHADPLSVLGCERVTSWVLSCVLLVPTSVRGWYVIISTMQGPGGQGPEIHSLSMVHS